MCKFEKDFTDPTEFYGCISCTSPFGYFDECTSCAPGSCESTRCPMVEEIQDLPSGAKIADYQEELAKMEAAEREQSELLSKKEAGLGELKELRGKFADKDRADIVEKIDADIKSVEAEIKAMKKSS